MKPDPQTEAEILGTAQKLDKALRSRDLNLAVNLFARQDGTIMVGSEAGETARGLQELRELFEQIFSGPITYGHKWDTVDIHALGTDTAWMFANGLIETISAAGHHQHPYRVTGIFRRGPDGWIWVHYHGSEPAG